MQVKAEVIESKIVSVNIKPEEVLQRLFANWINTVNSKAEYINQEGYWESWYDTGHGSGLTTTYNKATDEELEIMHSFTKVMKVTKGLKNI